METEHLTPNEELARLDELEESGLFVAFSLKHYRELSLENQMLMVFHAWKSTNLTTVRHFMDNVADPTSSDLEVGAFLKCHELKIKGDHKAGFEILEGLAKVSDSQIINYRYAAEYIDRGNLNRAYALMEKILPRLPVNRRRLIEFNYGMASNNQSNFKLTQETIDKLNSYPEPLSKYFACWLTAAFEAHRGEFQLSLDHYTKALALGQNIPSRRIDLGFLAFGILQQSVWVGNLEKGQEAYAFIEKIARESICSISSNRILLSTAMLDFLGGNITAATKRLDFLFGEEKWTRDHLIGGYAYLWILLATNRFDEMITTSQRLEKLRYDLGQSPENYDFELFKTYALYKSDTLSARDAFKTILAYCRDRTHIPQRFLRDWGNGMLYLFEESALERLKIVEAFNEFPILQRTFVWLLAQDQNLRMPIYWRHIAGQVIDPLAKALGEYRLSQLTHDIQIFTKSAKQVHALGALAWLVPFDKETDRFNYHLAHQVIGSSFVLDFDAQRIVAIGTCESLDTQPQMAKLFLLLARSSNGAHKELIAGSLGLDGYHPLQHDGTIYNMITRLRDWLKKHDRIAEIMHTPVGWKLNLFDRMVLLNPPSENSSQQMTSAYVSQQQPFSQDILNQFGDVDGPGMNPRLEWILRELSRRPALTRKDLMQEFQIQKSTAANDFNSLIEKGLIIRHGSGRGIFYRSKGVRR